MEWIDNIILGLFDVYGTKEPYELCDALGIHVAFVNADNFMLSGNNSLYIRDCEGYEMICIRNDLNKNYKQFYISHELGHAIIHPDIANSLNIGLLNRNKIEKQANYFAFKLINVNFNEYELKNFTIEQISSWLELPLKALKQLVNL